MEKNRKLQIGVIGLGTMGSAIVETLVRNEFVVTAFEPVSPKILLPPIGANQAPTLHSLVARLDPPRKILLMVTAGSGVDEIINQLTDYLEKGDIIIDGGNSHFADTERRVSALKSAGLGYIGAGISGGEQGARSGASIMVGGTKECFKAVRESLEAIAAADDKKIYCKHFGSGGVGHFIKMVHNGIEYGLLQAIGEAYLLLSQGLRLNHVDCASVFDDWQQGALNSYLIGITAEILKKEEESGDHLIAFIDDSADQTGTGRWMVNEAMNLGIPVPSIYEAVAARSLSENQKERREIVKIGWEDSSNLHSTIEEIQCGLIATFWCCLAQGFAMLSAGMKSYGWPKKEDEIAEVWLRGCIIRSGFLKTINQSYIKNPNLNHLFSCSDIGNYLSKELQGLRNAVSSAIRAGLPVPTMASAINYVDALKSERLWTALIQAQRDYFGAHTYRRIDREGSFHTHWAEGRG